MRKLILASELTASLPSLARELAEDAPGGRLLFVPTAARGEGWEPDDETHVRPFEGMGFEVRKFDLEGRTAEDVGDALDWATALYVCGGNTFYLMAHMRLSGFAGLVADRVDDGLAYIGSSAGALAACPSIGYAESLDDRSKGDGNYAGLGLVDFLVLPHMNHPDFGPAVRRVYAAIKESGGPLCIALDDGQMAVVEGRSVRIVQEPRS